MPTTDERNPRVDPKPGDVLRQGEWTSVVVCVEDGTVHYDRIHPTRLKDPFRTSKRLWRWKKSYQDAEVITRAND